MAWQTQQTVGPFTISLILEGAGAITGATLLNVTTGETNPTSAHAGDILSLTVNCENTGAGSADFRESLTTDFQGTAYTPQTTRPAGATWNSIFEMTMPAQTATATAGLEMWV